MQFSFVFAFGPGLAPTSAIICIDVDVESLAHDTQIALRNTYYLQFATSATELLNSIPALSNQMESLAPNSQLNDLPGWLGWLADVVGWLIVGLAGCFGILGQNHASSSCSGCFYLHDCTRSLQNPCFKYGFHTFLHWEGACGDEVLGVRPRSLCSLGRLESRLLKIAREGGCYRLESTGWRLQAGMLE